MKKLLKSILIATASVGAIAGSTAAVVSCGSKGTNTNQNDSVNQAKYDLQAKTLVDYVKAITEKQYDEIHAIKSNQTDDSIKRALLVAVNELMNTDPQGFDELSNLTDISAFTFLPPAKAGDFSHSFLRFSKDANNLSSGVKIKIPASSTSEATAHDIDFVVKYSISNATATSNDYEAATNGIKDYFTGGENTIVTLFKGITTDEIIRSIEWNISSYISGFITAPQQESLGLFDNSLIKVTLPTNLPIINDSNPAETKGLFGDITVTIPSNIGISKEIVIQGATYQPTSDSEGISTRVSVDLVEYFKRNSIAITPWSSTDNDFLLAIQAQITIYLNSLTSSVISLIDIEQTVNSVQAVYGAGTDRTVGTHYYNSPFDASGKDKLINLMIIPRTNPASTTGPEVELESYQYQLT